VVFNWDTVLAKARLIRAVILVSASRTESSLLETLSLLGRLMEHLLTQQTSTYNYSPWSPYHDQLIDYTGELYVPSHHVNDEQGDCNQVCTILVRRLGGRHTLARDPDLLLSTPPPSTSNTGPHMMQLMQSHKTMHHSPRPLPLPTRRHRTGQYHRYLLLVLGLRRFFP
jgi:hypothetical protein